jgi:serine/threonine-protein kinase
MAAVERTERVRAARGERRASSDARPASRLRRRGPLPEIRPGAPRYEVREAIHRGGMGEILLADIVGPEGFVRRVVLKGLLDRRDDDVASELFLREARLMARLDHPNIVQVFDLPVLHGRLYLAMEHVAGRNFHQIIQRGLEGRPPSLRLLLHVMAEALRGLHYAHACTDASGKPLGLVHRDVSPGNVLVSFFGEVKLTDFGIAYIEGAPRFTAPRSIRGKARYVAPEQVRGDPATVLSDVYSAGVVLAEALLGRALWEGRTISETLLAIVSEPREKTLDRIFAVYPDVPGLRSALRGALALRPEDRFASALQFAETLDAVGAGLGPRVSRTELGLALRDLFRGEPDVPEGDGFGHSGYPIPRFAMEEPETDATLVGVEERAPAPGAPPHPALGEVLDALDALDAAPADDTRPMSSREIAELLGRSGCPDAVPVSQPMVDLTSVQLAEASRSSGRFRPPPETPSRGGIRADSEAPEAAVAGPFAETLAEARAELRSRGALTELEGAPLEAEEAGPTPRPDHASPGPRERAPLRPQRRPAATLPARLVSPPSVEARPPPAASAWPSVDARPVVAAAAAHPRSAPSVEAGASPSVDARPAVAATAAQPWSAPSVEARPAVAAAAAHPRSAPSVEARPPAAARSPEDRSSPSVDTRPAAPAPPASSLSVDARSSVAPSPRPTTSLGVGAPSGVAPSARPASSLGVEVRPARASERPPARSVASTSVDAYPTPAPARGPAPASGAAAPAPRRLGWLAVRPDGESVTLLLAGILLGAALAITGCLVALLAA